MSTGPATAPLARVLDELYTRTERTLGAPDATREPLTALPESMLVLAERLLLDRFECELLLLAAAPQWDTRFGPLLARAQGDASRPWLSPRLALSLLPAPNWPALTPVARLRRWLLIELVGGFGPFDARIAVDETILQRMLGLNYPDPRLAPWFCPVDAADTTADTDSIEPLRQCWQQADNLAEAPVARLEQRDGDDFACALAVALGLRLFKFEADLLPHANPDTERLARLWEREALLDRSLLWVDVDALTTEQSRQTGGFLENLQGLILITGEQRLPLRRPQHTVSRTEPDLQERLAHWRQLLGPAGMALNGRLPALAEHFRLGRGSAGRIAAQWCASEGDGDALWEACRTASRRTLDGLAQRIDARSQWTDLVLPEGVIAGLRTIAAQVRQRARVHHDWGFAEGSSRGLGISALFAGGSGTGKTLAAEVLANELKLDLYRIDLANLVSKYIGETEKNLARVFAAAEASGAILLFDEADALFGKRSEVRDSHDRYANLEVSYLLQRMESYRGLAILTTNLRQAMDPAFARRLRFVLQFPFPDAQARARIWERVFPAGAPRAALAFDKLARLSLSGGHIRNLALNAAFLAADSDGVIGMHHLRIAAEAEFAKLERPLPAAEVMDWL